MNKLVFIFILLLVDQLHAAPLKVKIFSQKNAQGLEADQQILLRELEHLGHSAQLTNIYDPLNRLELVDVNIFFQRIVPECIPYASFNCFVPNPEWYHQGLEILQDIDCILCRTKEVERIFQGIGKTYFLGFTSIDYNQPEIEKDYSQILHLAGGSDLKGTPVILKVWARNPLFPFLTLVKRFHPYTLQLHNLQWKLWIEGSALSPLLNTCGIHLCLSETEGFGHYMMEAMSTRAVVVTTDAPPMNEFITDARCLVSVDKTSTQMLATKYYASPDCLESTLQELMRLSPEELFAIGANNRAVYLKKTEEFRENLKRLMEWISNAKEERHL
jgi:glycosyltransferase involved in cell wall biosynthesis